MFEAEYYAIITEGRMQALKRVPMFYEETADIILYCKRQDLKVRRYGVKVIGVENPWQGYEIVLLWAAQFSDIIQVEMAHTIIDKYGRF